MEIKLSQIKSKKCHCGIWDKKTGLECERCPLDSTFSKFHWNTTGYFCKIDDYKRGLIPDMEINLPTEIKPEIKEKNKDDPAYLDAYEEQCDFNKVLLNYLEIEDK